MSKPIVITETEGLKTHGNDLAVSPGATSYADNVVFSREGMPERRNGFKDYSTNLPDFAPTQLLASAAQDQAYLHLDNGIWYNDAGTWKLKGGNPGIAASITDGCYDTSGNRYALSNSCVYRVAVATGQIAPIAGRPGVTGTTDGTGSAARFTSPRALWYDGSANLYIADQHGIRKLVLSTAAVTTVCGSVSASGDSNLAGTNARFNTILGITGDGTNLYVNDSVNSKLKKIPISTFTPSTLESGTAYISKLAYGSSSLFCATATNLRKINASTGSASNFIAVSSATESVTVYGSDVYYAYWPGAGSLSIRKSPISAASETVVASFTYSAVADGPCFLCFLTADKFLLSDDTGTYLLEYYLTASPAYAARALMGSYSSATPPVTSGRSVSIVVGPD